MANSVFISIYNINYIPSDNYKLLITLIKLLRFIFKTFALNNSSFLLIFILFIKLYPLQFASFPFLLFASKINYSFINYIINVCDVR